MSILDKEVMQRLTDNELAHQAWEDFYNVSWTWVVKQKYGRTQQTMFHLPYNLHLHAIKSCDYIRMYVKDFWQLQFKIFSRENKFVAYGLYLVSKNKLILTPNKTSGYDIPLRNNQTLCTHSKEYLQDTCVVLNAKNNDIIKMLKLLCLRNCGV